MNFARAFAAYADGEKPDIERDGYIVPKRWTATHVAKRMLDAFGIIDATTTTPGPKMFGNGWPDMMREASDLVDAKAWANHQAAFGSAASRARARPTAAQIDMAEEACGWAPAVLPENSQEIDALYLWTIATARGLNVQRILNRRSSQADAMIAALRRRMGVQETVIRDPEQLQRTIAGVALSANLLLEEAVTELRAARERQARTKPESPKGIRADRDVSDALDDIVFARKHAVERVRKIALFEQLIVRPPEARIRRSEVMPGKVFTHPVYDVRRRDAAEAIADALDGRRVRVR